MIDRREVHIDEILNYAQNPRHDVGLNEIDTLKKLVYKVGANQMYNLARDICENGMIEASLPVLVYDEKRRKYVVYEGNRRIACLKFLNKPQLLSSIDKNLQQRFENLASRYSDKIPKTVFCIIANEERAFLIMERIHSGEDNGRGIKAWTSKEKAIFEERRKNKKSLALVIVEQTKKYLNKDLTDNIIDFTTITRLIGNRKVKKKLGIVSTDVSEFTKEKIQLINYLLEKALEESKKKNMSLTRLFNKADEIAEFFLPLIDEFNSTKIHQVTKNKTSPEKLTITLLKNVNVEFNPNQTIDLMNFLHVEKGSFNPALLKIECSQLNIIDGIVQPTNLPGDYEVTFTYYTDSKMDKVYWQDSLIIKIKKNKGRVIPSQYVLSPEFHNKYFNKITTPHSEKIKSLILFLTNESKDGRYAYVINAATRMFLEYLFRMYASYVLNYDNQTIEDKSNNNLKGFIDHCCDIIERNNPSRFTKPIRNVRQNSTNKIDLLQKSIHYYEVSISNDEIQSMLTNLSSHIDVVFEELIEAAQKKSQQKHA